MPLTEYQSQFRVLLQQEIEFSNQLLKNLQLENQALSNNDIESIQNIAPDKQQIIYTLESLSRQRESLLKNAGFSGDKIGMENFIKQYRSLDQDWQQLMSVVSKCQRQNEINGIIINAASRQTTDALSILKGQQSNNKVRYGSKGETINSTYTNPLAKA